MSPGYGEPNEPKARKRMQPAYGGEPCPLPPVCTPFILGQSGLIREAKKFCEVLKAELAIDEDGGHKWSGSQRQYLRQELAKWRVRALGEDSHYMRHGTHIRPPHSHPPGHAEHWQATVRQKHLLKTGLHVSTAAHKRRFKQSNRSAIIQNIVKRWKKQYGTKDTDPPED